MIGIGSRSSLQESLFRYLAIHLLFFSSNRLITSIAAVTPSFHKGGGGGPSLSAVPVTGDLSASCLV